MFTKDRHQRYEQDGKIMFYLSGNCLSRSPEVSGVFSSLKGIVGVFTSDPPWKEGNVWFAQVPLQGLSAVVHLNFRAGSTFPAPVCTVPHGQTLNRTSRCNKVDTVRLYASYRLDLLYLKGQRCVFDQVDINGYNLEN